ARVEVEGQDVIAIGKIDCHQTIQVDNAAVACSDARRTAITRVFKVTQGGDVACEDLRGNGAFANRTRAEGCKDGRLREVVCYPGIARDGREIDDGAAFDAEGRG